jgi:hypothetical protein
MSEQSTGIPTLLHEEEEMLGDPSFEIWVREGTPVVSGSYFLHPPLRAVSAEWDAERAGRLLVKADDGTDWVADDVPQTGSVTVVLRPASGTHPAFTAANAG